MRASRLLLLPAALTCAVAAIAPGASSALAAPASSASAAAPVGALAARPVAALVTDIAPGLVSSDPADLTAMGGTLFFTASDGPNGRELWRSDGTAAGTVRLTGPGTASPAVDPADLTAADGVLFFSAFDPGHGRELWRSDGTSAGTRLVADIVPGPVDSGPQDITYAVGQQAQNPPDQVLVYFSAWDPAHGRELWRSDGTKAGTSLVADIDPGAASSEPAQITPVAGTVAMFSADDGTYGREPWTTDGTGTGTALYEDLNPGPAGSDPANITPTVLQAGILATLPFWYLTATTPATGRELFAAFPHGGNITTQAIPYDINPGTASSNPGPFDSVAQDTGLISANDGTHGRELFELEQPPVPVGSNLHGTASLGADINPGAASSNPVTGPASVVSNTPLFFPFQVRRTFVSAGDGSHGRELWQVDEGVSRGPGEGGTLSFGIAGTRLVADIAPGSIDSGPRELTPVGGTPDGINIPTEVFSADDGSHGRELWYSGGYASNTAMVADINPGPADSGPSDITAIGQTAYFSADDGTHGRELWKVTVPAAPSTFLSGPEGPVTAGSPVTVTVVLNGPNATALQTPTGNVTFYDNGAKVASVPVTPGAQAGQATASATVTAGTGTGEIVAVYEGDSAYASTTSNTVLVTGG